jgi:chromosome partitioning protein
MSKIVTVAIRKGGSGKTTTAVNLAAGLQYMGHKTLLVDLDQSANATMHVGINPYTLISSINTLFTDINAKPQNIVQVTSFSLSVLPATGDLERTEAGMTATQVGVLKPILAELDGDYEYIIIDTPPSHSYLSISALVASHYVLIPLEPHFLAMDGLAKIMDDIGKVKQGLNPNLAILGIIPVKVQEHTNLAQSVLRQVQAEYPDKLLPLKVRFSIKIAEAALYGQPVYAYAPQNEGAREYAALSEVIYAKTR